MTELIQTAQEYINSIPLYTSRTVKNEEWGFRHAVVTGRLDMVKCFMALSRYKCPVQWGLETAVERGLADIVEYFISTGSRGHCYIVNAATNGHLRVVKLLVESGANCRFLNDWPLCLAARGGHLSTVEYLVSKGSDPSIDNYLPLRWASSYDHLELVKFLVLNGSKSTSRDSSTSLDSSTLLYKFITPRQRRYISFCLEMEKKLRDRAQKKIYFWWIPICYDTARPVGTRMMHRNLAEFQRLISL